MIAIAQEYRQAEKNTPPVRFHGLLPFPMLIFIS